MSRPSRQSGGSDLDPAEFLLVQKLEGILSETDARNEVVAQLLGQHQLPLVLRIRFVCAINELMRAEDDSTKDWTSRARHVVKVFLDSKSRFHLEDDALPSTIASELYSASSATSLESALSRAKAFVMIDLTKNELIRSRLRETE
jgi:hypothetical protein